MSYQFVQVDCPYCGFRNKVLLDGSAAWDFQIRPFIRVCDSEQGGCDREFALKLKITIEPQIFVLSPARNPEDPF